MVAVKNDQGKLRMDLVTPEMERSLSEVLTYGMGVYGERNWENGIADERLYAAARRHLLAWCEGETVNAESGLLHLDHAFCNLGMLVTMMKRRQKMCTK